MSKKYPADGSLPTLDLGPFLAGEVGAAQRLAPVLRQIQEEVGYYAVINHGIPSDLFANALEQVTAFHALPLEEKMILKADARDTGYVPFKSSVYVTSPLNNNTEADLNENLRLVRERPDDHPSIRAGRRFSGPNKWPSENLLPEFRSVILAYYDALEGLAGAMLPLYALALDLPANFFDADFDDPTWMTRNIHYPAVAPTENQFAAAPHRDHSFLSFLPMSEIPGLEFQDADGNWIAPTFRDDAILINAGEFMHLWTNGRFIATPHRVLAPPRERHMMVFFYNPRWDVMSTGLPSCVGPDNPARYKPIQFLDHLCNYVDQNYPGLASHEA